MVVVVVLSLPFLWVVARRPVLRRLALRNAARRPRESMLVVLGSMLGTAIMTGSFVVGDTFDASIRAGAFRQLGPVDEVVSVLGLDARQQLDGRLGDFDHPDVDGVLTAVRTGAAVAAVTEQRRAEPQARLLEVDFDAARAFGGDERATGISGATPAAGEAVLVGDLARDLGVRVGDEIDVFAYGSTARLRVVRLLPQRGVAGLWLEQGTSSPNVFVASGTVAELMAGAVVAELIAEPPSALLLVSNRGDVEGGAVHSEVVKAALEERTEGLLANVATSKADLMEVADTNGQSLTDLYTSLGMFAVLAGILLLVNIFFMLADERKSELGMLRALGLRRGSLVAAFATEGWGYAAVASAVGTFVGLGLGRVMMVFAGRIFSSGPDDFRLSLDWHFEWASVWSGFAFGFTISIITIVLTSVWLSRFNIISAIRNLSEPMARRPRRRAQLAGLLGAAAGAALTSWGAVSGPFIGVALGPVLLIAGLGPALARRFPRDSVVAVLAALVLAWGVAMVPVGVALDVDMDVLLFFVQGAVMVAASVVLVSRYQSAIGHALSRFAARSLNVRLGLAYPLARKFRTGLTLGMFALVVFVLVYVSAMSAMFARQLDSFTADVSGGFDTIVTSNAANPVPLEALEATDGVVAVAPLSQLAAEIVPEGETDPDFWYMTAFTADLVRRGAPVLDDRGGYETDEAAYRAVLENSSLAIVDEFFLSAGAGPPSATPKVGDRFLMRDPVTGEQREMEVAAIAKNDWVFNGGLMGMDAARDVFGERAVVNRAYLATEDPSAVVARLQRRFLENGAEAEPIRDTVETFLALQQQFFVLMRGYLALGLVVGTAGIGVIMVRAVRERRRQVGVLRALGFDARSIRSAFVIEASFVAVEGVFCGALLALVSAYSLTITSTFGTNFEFVVPVLSVVTLVLGTLLITYLATAAPARAAARIRPAAALRITD